MEWVLYLYLGMLGKIEVDEPFARFKSCHSDQHKEVADFKAKHTHAAAFGWCVRGGGDQ